MSNPALMFAFDENFKIVAVYPKAETDIEETKLQELAKQMVKAIQQKDGDK
ncbi:MAG: hypothetical protein M0P57_14665 [Syntrophales bacterium]|nr:hypothetical protein [Syntrophales bacterium]